MNCFKTLTTMMLGVAVLVGAAMLCPAQTGPITQPSITQPSILPANGSLTPETLKAMLINLGYDPKEDKVGDVMHYLITVDSGLKYTVDFSISSNSEKIWAMVSLTDLPANVEVPAARLLKLLELNQTTVGPAHFAYVAGSRFLYLNRALENREVTPKLLKQQIERVVGSCDLTREYWDVRKWSEMKPVVTPK